MFSLLASRYFDRQLMIHEYCSNDHLPEDVFLELSQIANGPNAPRYGGKRLKESEMACKGESIIQLAVI